MEEKNDPWLPISYEVPKASGNYMKLDEETNKFRILSKPIMGYEYWTKANKPVRSRDYPETRPDDIREDSKIKHFWAFAVWSYRDERVQILELTQATIQRGIADLVSNEDWGDPQGYDLTITGKGEGLERKYTVQPSPHKPTPQAALAAYKETPVYLETLFDGGDPFKDQPKTSAPPSVITSEDSPF